MNQFRCIQETLKSIILVENDNDKAKGLWWGKNPLRCDARCLKDCILWAMKGGIRAAVLAFAGRSSFNIILVLLKIRSLTLKQFLASLRHSILGLKTTRFSLMLGCFVATYKFILNALPNSIKSTQEAHRTHWHATLAGTIAGTLAALFEKREGRVTVAQQAFVSVAQIGAAWETRQDTLPAWYVKWISKATQAPKATLRIKSDLNTKGVPDLEDIHEILELPYTTPRNHSYLERYFTLFISPPFSSSYRPPYAPCSAIHPEFDSCLSSIAVRVLSVGMGILPVYGAIHFLGPLLFNRKQLLNYPLSVLGKSTFRTLRSSTFLGLMIAFYQVGHCGKHQLHEYLYTQISSKTSPAVDLFLTSKWSYYIPGLLAGFSILVEEKHRRTELAMYVFPKALESLLVDDGYGW
ncbi:hypothetical protein AAF712_010087 [Marasmius tenuissimus]|uniref:Transmembrane protein 135 N-terminal domain-containing protein n=1 Tax=Marasmius tenuissimus TaxID=585030 RepID=A0ABR2ZPQ7_9AGAR